MFRQKWLSGQDWFHGKVKSPKLRCSSSFDSRWTFENDLTASARTLGWVSLFLLAIAWTAGACTRQANSRRSSVLCRDYDSINWLVRCSVAGWFGWLIRKMKDTQACRRERLIVSDVKWVDSCEVEKPPAATVALSILFLICFPRSPRFTWLCFESSKLVAQQVIGNSPVWNGSHVLRFICALCREPDMNCSCAGCQTKVRTPWEISSPSCLSTIGSTLETLSEATWQRCW